MFYRHRVLGLLFLLSIITYLDRVCISVAGPRMQADLGISPREWGWVVGLFTLSYALFEVPSGSMGDRIGARRVLTRIVLWWSAFTTLTGFVSNYYVLLLTRFLFGAGEAGAYPNSSSAISRWFAASERGRAQGVVWMGSRIGGAIAPLAVVSIQVAWGWRASFYVFGIAGVVWALVWYLSYRDRPPEAAASPTSAHAGLPWRRALRNGNLWTIMLMYHCYCLGSYFYISWLHTYLQKGRGFSEQEMKLYSVLPFIAGIFGNLTGGFATDWLTRRKGLLFGRVAVGSTALAISAGLLFATAVTKDRMAAVVFLMLGYGFMDCMLPVSWAVCLDVGRKYAGAVTGAMNMAGQIGSFVSSVAFGYLVEYFQGDYNKPLIPMAAMLLISAALYLRIDPRVQVVAEA